MHVWGALDRPWRQYRTLPVCTLTQTVHCRLVKQVSQMHTFQCILHCQTLIPAKPARHPLPQTQPLAVLLPSHQCSLMCDRSRGQGQGILADQPLQLLSQVCIKLVELNRGTSPLYNLQHSNSVMHLEQYVLHMPCMHLART